MQTENRIKICHLTSVHPENDVRIFGKECISLVKAGFDVSFVVSGATDKITDGIKIYGAKRYDNRYKRILLSGKQVLQKALAIDADLYHFHDPELLKIGAKLKKRGKIVIYDSHEDLPRQILTKHWIPQCLRKTASTITEFIENHYVKKMCGIIAATPFIQQRFQKIVKTPVENINNYPVLSEITNQTEWKEKQKAVCYVGGIFLERGIFEMVRAIGKTKYRLNLAGKFSPESLQQEAAKEKGWQQVDYQGFLNRSEINTLLNRSMAGLLILHDMPSYRQSLPVKMFEYMAAGIPVICSDFALWKQIIEEADCGVCVAPLDIETIAKEITSLIADPEKSKKMGENGRRAVENIYNWETESKKLIAFYKNLLKSER